jgi:hypothetical protein
VGQGPSAEGKGDIIDACDFVVRLQDWWHCGAVNAGQKLDAHAYFNMQKACPTGGWEQWITQYPRQVSGKPDGQKRITMFAERAMGGVIRWLAESQWKLLHDYLKADPSTGFVAVAMALWRYPAADELVLYGFDSTVPDQANFFDAREESKREPYRVAHHILAEKRVIAEIHNGTWLGRECKTALVWPDMPGLTQERKASEDT